MARTCLEIFHRKFPTGLRKENAGKSEIGAAGLLLQTITPWHHLEETVFRTLLVPHMPFPKLQTARRTRYVDVPHGSGSATDSTEKHKEHRASGPRLCVPPYGAALGLMGTSSWGERTVSINMGEWDVTVETMKTTVRKAFRIKLFSFLQPEESRNAHPSAMWQSPE